MHDIMVFIASASIHVRPRRCDKCTESSDDLTHRRSLDIVLDFAEHTQSMDVDECLNKPLEL